MIGGNRVRRADRGHDRGFLSHLLRRPLVAVALGGLILASCTTVRSGLGTTNGPCFVALPTASAAVHGQGHLNGVRLAWDYSLTRTSPVYRHALAGRVLGAQRFCVVAYSGRFHRAAVEHPWGRKHGSLAIVVITYPSRKLVVTIVVHHPPNRFGHPHFASY